MKLRTKILLGVGVLLFFMVITMYILPAFFVKKDVFKAANEIHDLIIEGQKELLESQKTWMTLAYEKTKQNMNAILYMLYEMKSMSSELILSDQNSMSKVWLSMINVAALDPDVAFVQTHSLSEKQTAVLTISSAPLLPVRSWVQKKNVTEFSLQRTNAADNANFFGIRLPDSFQVDEGYTYFVLANARLASEELSEIHNEIENAFKEFLSSEQKNHQSYVQELKGFSFPIFSGSVGYYWALKMHMVRLLAPFYVNGIKFHGTPKVTPQGIVRVDKEGNGLAVLTNDVFGTKPLFDDKVFYETHSLGKGPSTQGSVAVIVDHKTNQSYMAQTILLDTTLLSIGSGLDYLAQELALASNEVILMQVLDEYWVGFNGDGIKLEKNELDEFVTSKKKQSEVSTVNGIQYFIAPFSSLDNGRIKLFQVHQIGGEKSILGTLFSLENKLTNRISMQLSLVSLGTMILVLIFIGRLGLQVIYPVTRLANATEDVMHGRYEDVKLPVIGNRKDEIATLIRSFEDMVKGLQEREKIRGVLDKVVSKDVADEILRTQIHLGGEDRVVTMLFSDIRGFSTLTENLSPQQTIHILNGCMTKISRVIEGEGGVIDKYVGDEVMAIFGAPTSHPDHALRAVSAGMLIIETLKHWNKQRVENMLPPIEMGIGVHSGLVVAGNMGAEDRLNYTVLGANVNLAARLCEVASRNQLIISENTLKQPNIEESFFVKALTPITLKGFSEPIPIYEVVGFKWEET